MDLLARYLQDVRFWLPRRQREDIVAELAENLRSEIEEREAASDRPLGQDEICGILTRWGHPLLVAERYVPRDHLIGPVYLPLYKFVLALVSALYLLPWLLAWTGMMIFDPGQRTGAAVRDTVISFWLMSLHAFAAITLIFVVVERVQRKSRSLEAWTASRLLGREPARDPREIPRSESIAALVAGPLMIWWWLTLMGSQVVYELDDAIRITLRPIAATFYWPTLAVLVAGAVLAAVNLFKPWWSRPRAVARLAVDTLSLVLAGLLITAGPIVDSIATGVDADRAGRLAVFVTWANLSWYITLAVIAAASLYSAIQALRLVIGARPGATPYTLPAER